MILFLSTFILGCDSHIERSVKIEGCYHDIKTDALLASSEIDPIEVRWGNGIEEVCRYSDGSIHILEPNSKETVCDSSEDCPRLPKALFQESPPVQISMSIFKTEEQFVWSSFSLAKRLEAVDEEWSAEYLSLHGGQVTLKDGTELSLVSPAQIFVNGERVELEQIKCLVMLDIQQPYQTLCLFRPSGQGYAHIGEWVNVRRFGDSGFDLRRAYTLNDSKSYLGVSMDKDAR